MLVRLLSDEAAYVFNKLLYIKNNKASYFKLQHSILIGQKVLIFDKVLYKKLCHFLSIFESTGKPLG